MRSIKDLSITELDSIIRTCEETIKYYKKKLKKARKEFHKHGLDEETVKIYKGKISNHRRHGVTAKREYNIRMDEIEEFKN